MAAMFRTPDAAREPAGAPATYGAPSAQPIHRDLCDVFIKIGGSILDHEAATAALVPSLVKSAARTRVLILTGGGQVAKRIKANQIKHGHDFYRFWRATGLTPEVNAWLLASYSPIFSVVSCAAEIAECLQNGTIPVFAPTGAILSSLYFLPDWLVTTDSIGLQFASQSGARRYVIVSDVDGIYERKPEEGGEGTPIPRLTAHDLEHLSSSKLDRGFVDYFRRYPLSTVIVNGRHPDRVSAAIEGVRTLGTEILCSC
jgi:5-(aminomethyl)-3-furanmethanol phosphate kinase